MTETEKTQFAAGFPAHQVGGSLLVNADCFNWLAKVPAKSIHAVVTDPPYGVIEFEDHHLEKRANGKGGIWRLPPSFDGHTRSPLPRFTALTPKDRAKLRKFFCEWTKALLPALAPGAHVFVAGNAFLAELVFGAITDCGLEFRGEIIRLLRTLRGGDRPKNAEKEFPNVCALPRGCFEPWALFRAPMPPKMTVAECLRTYGTGGLRRLPDGGPFLDVIKSEKTPRRERKISSHPSLKPQSLMRQLAFAALPLGRGVILDTFAGSGSTLAAANAVGVTAVGIEKRPDFYQDALKSIPQLAALELSAAEPEEDEELEQELELELKEEPPVRRPHRKPRQALPSASSQLLPGL